jgi:hypothetical protein
MADYHTPTIPLPYLGTRTDHQTSKPILRNVPSNTPNETITITFDNFTSQYITPTEQTVEIKSRSAYRTATNTMTGEERTFLSTNRTVIQSDKIQIERTFDPSKETLTFTNIENGKFFTLFKNADGKLTSDLGNVSEKAKPVTGKQFVEALGFMESLDHNYLRDLERFIDTPPSQKTATRPQQASANPILHTSPTLAIQTDGTCSVIAAVDPTNPHQSGALYHKHSGANPASARLTASFQVNEAFNQGDNLALPRHPGAKPLKDSLPDAVHQQLSDMLARGGQIRVDYVDKVEGCPTTGSKPPSQLTPRRP